MNILIDVIYQYLRVVGGIDEIIDGSQAFVRFIFNLPHDWDDLMVFAQFTQNNESYNQYLDENNSVILPNEITPGKFKIMLFGSGGDVTATTKSLSFTVNNNIISLDE